MKKAWEETRKDPKAYARAFRRNQKKICSQVGVPQTSLCIVATRVSLSEAELSGWILASKVGRIGHPVIRQALRQLPVTRYFLGYRSNF